MKYSFLFFLIVIYSSLGFANLIVDEKGCTTKMIQVMKPEYPRANYQGYAIIQFDINKDPWITFSNFYAVQVRFGIISWSSWVPL